jgi:myo-inositol 2-dehydrogenase / D-chiro-inositol 1-dehydrogenase
VRRRISGTTAGISRDAVCEEDVFRFGLIGAGRMGRTHLRALTGSTTVEVSAVVEPVPAARAAMADTGRAVFEDVAQLLAAGGIDGVLIAAPTTRHIELVTQVAAAGVPILCEKPCGLSTAGIRQAQEAVEHHGVPFQVAYWRRYVPALQALRQRIEGGELGEIHLFASSQWDGQPPSAAFRAHSGGIFRDMGVHEFDQVRWLSGQDFGQLSAVPGPLNVDPEDVSGDVDSAQAIAQLSGGASAIVSLGRYFPGGDMARIEVFGTRDAMRCDFLDPKDGEQAQLEALGRQAEGFAAFAKGGPLTGASIQDAMAALDAAERASAAILRLQPAAAGANS